ncbi:DUF397 domain-containing protein [Nocardiopsis sp. NPDC101807]|uniref:DUF397 domain-containing protein n=1 Tax=Nocardiopsis sp. NPDC101807 TaxID=3364339 RepID=UPI003805789D
MNAWHKSSYSDGSGGNCVEVREGLVTGIRDTQNRGQGQIDLPSAEWIALMSTVRGQ